MSVQVDVSEECYKKLDSQRLFQALDKAVKDTVIELEGECKDYAPYVTGKLHDSFSYDYSSGEGTIQAQINNTSGYWMYLEYGTRYIPPYGFIQRAIEVTEPGAKIVARFQQNYGKGGK